MNTTKAEKKSAKSERTRKALFLCRKLGCLPRHIFDFQLFALLNEYFLVPQQVEQLLAVRGHIVKDDESLSEKISEMYGEEVASLMEELI